MISAGICGVLKKLSCTRVGCSMVPSAQFYACTAPITRIPSAARGAGASPWCTTPPTPANSAHREKKKKKIPYIYTMAWRNAQEGLPLITPLYYSHPDAGDAYECPQAYWFGSELIAAPFTAPASSELGLSRQPIWLPEGDWFNFFTGAYFAGGWHVVYGDLSAIPVLAKGGTGSVAITSRPDGVSAAAPRYADGACVRGRRQSLCSLRG